MEKSKQDLSVFAFKRKLFRARYTINVYFSELSFLQELSTHRMQLTQASKRVLALNVKKIKVPQILLILFPSLN